MRIDSHKLCWVGPRRSDLLGIEQNFSAAIVLMGKESSAKDFKCISYEHENKNRLNHNDKVNKLIITTFFNNSLLDLLNKNKDILFLWYGNLTREIDQAIVKNSPFSNRLDLTDLLSDKLKIRLILSSNLPVVPGHLRFTNRCDYSSLKNSFPEYDSFIIQDIYGTGGYSTFTMRTEQDNWILNKIEGYECIVSAQLKNSTPLNSHIIITRNDICILPSSVQIINELNNRLLYVGGDFATANNMSSKTKSQLEHFNYYIGCELLNLGYLGVAGIDYLVSDAGELIFVEINPRFQASTVALNQHLLRIGQPSVQELHIRSFEGAALEINTSPCNYSVVTSLIDDTGPIQRRQNITAELKTPDPRTSNFNKDTLSLIFETDDASEALNFEIGSQNFRVILDRPVLGEDYRGRYHLMPAVKTMLKPEHNRFQCINRNEIERIALLKFELLVYGVRISKEALQAITASRLKDITIRDGIAGGLDIRIFNDIYVNVPFKESYAFISPYEIQWMSKIGFVLFYKDEEVSLIDVFGQPSFVGKKTTRGEKFENIGQIFTDRLSIAPFRACVNNMSDNNACKFCEIGNSPIQAPTALDDIKELVQYCLDNPGANMHHILVSGGTPPPDNWSYLVEVIREIRKLTNLKIYQMIEPPDDLEKITKLFDAGVSEFGCNMEIFNQDIAKIMMPKKGKITRQYYINVLEYAVSLWGDKGNVRSILIVGLEPIESTLKGVTKLCEIGVMPILSPFRPIPNTPLANFIPPDPEQMWEVWKRAQEICAAHQLTLGPTCIACQNNVIAIPVNDLYYFN